MRVAGERSEGVTESRWAWPEAWDPPILDSPIYQDRHPTRYVWRPDVESWARWLVDEFPEEVWCNTYYEHPGSGVIGVPGRGFEIASIDDDTVWYIMHTSIDVWDYQGRNYAIDPSLGQWIFRILMDYPYPPDIRWIIWRTRQYGAWNDWQGEPFGWDDFTWHYDHIHVTYW
jgi:hypothetical protein